MTLTDIEKAYLRTQSHARLATVAPDGAPQNKPVGFDYNAELGTIDIYGMNMEKSAKFRNVTVNPEVAFVVDDVFGNGAEGVRFLEIRGRAETVQGDAPDNDGHLSRHFIRIHPRRITGWNVVPDRPGLYTRDVRTIA
ncbi:PPOX class F420-dependent oxidoreductase [Nocardia miyunensis]|uniref:PPOX class F420-dependent oxidoreductase n=1 Tax=Nocardia miyunensis TaxID=282684 RepID=UPI0008329F37|nr:PPOX class F420-dependent oxidoreductase [Nocardia miyunensis]